MTLAGLSAALAVEAAGWIGGALVLVAYVLVSTKRWTGDSAPFQWLNLVGAAGLAVNGAWHRAWPAAALDAVWALIGLAALAGIARRRSA